MSRISRREYLKQIGAAGLILGAAELDHFAQESTNATEQTARRTAANADFRFHPKTPTAVVTAVRFPDWPLTDTRPNPTQPLATLRFTGLSMFTYNRTEKRCEIGLLKNNDGRHGLRLLAYEYDPATPDTHISDPLPVPTNMMSISLQGADSEVRFLKMRTPDPHDFKNMLDLNSDEFWPGKSLEKGKFKPRIIVNNGTFLCLKLTDYKFDRVEVPRGPLELVLSTSNPSPLGHFLKVAGAEIGLASNQKISVTIDSGTPILLPRDNGHSVTIVFDNECKESGHDCDFDRDSRFETRRGDFHFHRGALSLGAFETKYGLKFDPTQLTPDGLDIVTRERPRGTDLAPCMGVGAGEAPGLPPETT